MAVSLSDTDRRRALLAVAAVVFVDLLGAGIVIPVLPFYTRSFGGNELVIGLLAASFSLTQFLLSPFLGTVSDRYGRRPVILGSLAVEIVAWIVFGYAASLLVLFASRLLAGAAAGNISTAQAYVADVTEPAERTRALGLLGAAFGLGFVVGPTLGAVLAYQPTVDAVAAVAPAFVPISHFSLPAFAAAFIALVNLAAAARYLPEPRVIPDASVETGDRPSAWSQLAAAARAPGLAGLLAAFFFANFAFSGVQIMFIPFVADVYGFGSAQAAALLAYIGVLAVVVQGGVVGPLEDAVGAERATVGGAALLALVLAALPFSPQLGGVLFGWLAGVGPAWLTPGLDALLLDLGLLSLGNGVLNVTLTAVVSSKASADLQGSAFGLTQSAGSLARTIGPIVMGGLYAAAGYWSPFALGALVLLPVIAIAAVAARDVDRLRPVDPGNVR